MFRFFTALLIVCVVIAVAVSACVPAMKTEDFRSKTPALVPEQYFAGRTKGHGVFFDRFRNLKTSFVVDLEGTWDGSKVLLLRESLTYEDGTKSDRTFTITKQEEGRYVVEMPDLDGPGVIEAAGNCMRWSYRMRQDIGSGRIITLTFDDWMFLQKNEIVLNRAFASKFGLSVGEVFMSVQKVSESSL